jgi:CHAT domain-containing protein
VKRAVSIGAASCVLAAFASAFGTAARGVATPTRMDPARILAQDAESDAPAWLVELWPAAEDAMRRARSGDAAGARALLESFVGDETGGLAAVLCGHVEAARGDELLELLVGLARRVDAHAVEHDLLTAKRARLEHREGTALADLLALDVDIASTHFARGDLSTATALARQVLERAAQLPEAQRSAQVARRLLATVSARTGDVERAAQELAALLAEIEASPESNVDVLCATRLELATALRMLGDAEGALVLCRAAVDAWSVTRSGDDRDLVGARANLASALKDVGDLEAALAIEREVVEARRRVFGEGGLELASAEVNLAATLARMGRTSEARDVFERVHAANVVHLPRENNTRCIVAFNLANTRLELGDAEGALALFEDVHAVWGTALPPEHPNRLALEIALATTRLECGDVARALRELEDLRARTAEVLPGGHPHALLAAQNLGVARARGGDAAGAREVAEAVFEQFEAALGIAHPETFAALVNLASARADGGDVAGALELLESGLAARGELGDDLDFERWTAELLAAHLTRRLHGASASRARLEQLVGAATSVLPEDHAWLLTARSELAASLFDVGERTAARDMELAIARARTQQLPPGHPDRIVAWQNLTASNAYLLDFEALDESFGALLAEQRLLVRQLPQLATRAARAVAQSELARTSFALELCAFLTSEERPAPYAEVFEIAEALRSASLASVAVARTARAHPQVDAAQRAFGEERRNLAEVAARPPTDPEALARWRAELVERAEIRDTAERRMRELLDEHGLSVPEPTLERLQASLGADEAVATILRHETDFTIEPGAAADESFTALVLTRSGSTVVALGPCAPIEAALREWRAALGAPLERGLGARDEDVDPEAAERSAGAAARALVLDPLLVPLASTDTRRLHLVLDDVLHLVPFDALPLDDGERVGNRMQVVLAPSIAALIDRETPGSLSGTFVAFGGVDFDERSAAPSADSSVRSAPTNEASVERSGRRRFAPLVQTRYEVETIAELHAEHCDAPAHVKTRSAASKAALHELAPQACVLHVATHGWFVPESEAASMLDRDAAAGALAAGRAEHERLLTGFLPETLCGLAFAGANSSERGLLYAEELGSLDLTHCELAVLSACETNVGLRRAGQGIQSLQNALHAAGARCTITSLWKVDDAATRRLFELFYADLWTNGVTPVVALWNAKTALASEGHPPKDWAGWVVSGSNR